MGYRAWGSDNGDRLDVSFSEEELYEILARIDVTQVNSDFVEHVCELARKLDALLMLPDLRVIEPDPDVLLAELRQSREHRLFGKRAII